MYEKPLYEPSVIHGAVYVIECEDGFYYVGYTENINFRYSQHLQNKGAVWTRRHKPIKLVEVICPGTKKLEDEITEKYMSIYGQGKVRGGKYVANNYCECCNIQLKNYYPYCKPCAYKRGLIPYF